jgi:hypothetical protein
MTAELYGGKPLAEALTPAWDGGVYYAAQRKDATDAQKQTTASLALLYTSRWKNEDSARSFFEVFDQEMPRQYDGLQRRQADEKDENERVYTTREGDVLLILEGKRVWVSEGFDLATARKLREQVDAANLEGRGPTMVARKTVDDRELTGEGDWGVWDDEGGVTVGQGIGSRAQGPENARSSELA